MEEFFQNLMNSWIINDNDELEYSISKTIENWDLNELFTITTNKGV